MTNTLYDVFAIDANGKRTDVGQYDDQELDQNDHVEQADWRKVDHSRGFIAEPAHHVNLGQDIQLQVDEIHVMAAVRKHEFQSMHGTETCWHCDTDYGQHMKAVTRTEETK
jgi:hypothetical protein